uniref:NPH3 domain-containing protein n=1 Tax=Haemonchus contortus TaxID=6289 RepID=A0A7I4YMN8_HAECO
MSRRFIIDLLGVYDVGSRRLEVESSTTKRVILPNLLVETVLNGVNFTAVEDIRSQLLRMISLREEASCHVQAAVTQRRITMKMKRSKRMVIEADEAE